MDIRDVLVDGISQLTDWMEEALEPLNNEQLNWLPDGKTVSIGFNAWHVYRTTDNIANFVFRKTPPIWIAQNYFERMELPKVDQGTGMALEGARGIIITDKTLLQEYGNAVMKDTMAYIKTVSDDELGQMQMIKPLGEMPRWRVFRQVMMTHGFMHLGEIGAFKGILGLQFSI